ncbi:MAG TPA: SDR family oxidoreductase [Solirubrobacteraceae bacterium]|jgi:thioester reductase-like protein|nr:SDR family oxidoreductase [Solirubrobacteraceae bacterium]
MSDTVLLTGATGFLGMEVLARLLQRSDCEMIALVRARDRAAAEDRVMGVSSTLYEDVAPALGRVRAMPADLARGDLGLSAADRREVLRRATSIVHCAASIAFDLPLAQARSINAGGTARMLSLAHELNAAGRLRRMVHISTAYVCGRRAGVFAESQLDTGQVFRNTYERSKAHAERILRCGGADLPLVVARPSIVVGDSRCGWTPCFNVVYWPLQAFARGLIGEIPADPDGVLDIVPVDYVADAILALHDDDATGTVHLVAGEHAVSNRQLLELACARLGRPAPRFARAGASPRAHMPGVREADAYLAYFDVRATFDDARARELLAPRGVSCPPLQRYFSTLIDYAERARWGKLSPTRASTHDRAGAGVA